MAHFASLRWLLALWLLFLFAMAMAPLPIKIQLHTIGRWHSAGHCLAFFITAVLLFWNAVGLRSELGRFAIVMSIAFSMEFLENVFYHAGFEWHDIVFDAAGTLAAWALIAFIRPVRNRQEAERVLVSGQPAKLR